MEPFEALYERRCRYHVGLCEVGEFALLVPDLVYNVLENRKRDLHFGVGDWVYLKISPMKWVIRFGKKRISLFPGMCILMRY